MCQRLQAATGMLLDCCSSHGLKTQSVSCFKSCLRRHMRHLAACRFRYRQVSKADYGLRIEDILGLDSKDLNQVGVACLRSSRVPLPRFAYAAVGLGHLQGC